MKDMWNTQEPTIYEEFLGWDKDKVIERGRAETLCFAIKIARHKLETDRNTKKVWIFHRPYFAQEDEIEQARAGKWPKWMKLGPTFRLHWWDAKFKFEKDWFEREKPKCAAVIVAGAKQVELVEQQGSLF